MQRITSQTSQPLFSVASTRRIEQLAAARLPPHTLIQRAGLAVAQLALAVAPHARRIWIACGPGNNGGDGFEAALQLHLRGKAVAVTWTGAAAFPPDAAAARQRALVAGVPVLDAPPADFDLCIDALLGIGAAPLDSHRAGGEPILAWLSLMQASSAVRLSIDVPTGLNADTGVLQTRISDATHSIAANARNDCAKRLICLSLLTLKPGLFMADGRDSAGQVWFDDLDISGPATPDVWLLGADRAMRADRSSAPHGSHKGSFGDVAVMGGESDAARGRHMAGAALLAARAALHAGAGRVFVSLLPPGPSQTGLDNTQPELMFRSPDTLDLKRSVVVCGCGGGQAITSVLAKVLSTAPRAVFDADALNAISADSQLRALLTARTRRGYATVITPHPLEAARLLGSSAAVVQADRLLAARTLADRFGCVVILKGSGSLVAAPGVISALNSTGNALLATAGTGDVLAGMVGAALAGNGELTNDAAATLSGAFSAACSAVFSHGLRADHWLQMPLGRALTASALLA